MKPRIQNCFKLFIVFFLVFISLTSNFTVAEAAKRDRTAPTAPTNLKAAGITNSTVSLTWTSSTDNSGVKGYDVYKNNIFIGNTSSTSYTVGNLSSNTSYSFFVKARDTSGNVSAASNTINVTTSAPAVDQPPQVSSIQVSPIASDGQTIGGTVTLSVSPSDDKGISKVEFYSNNGAYLIGTRTSAPFSLNWATDPWVPDGSQTLKAIVYDTAIQTAQVSKRSL